MKTRIFTLFIVLFSLGTLAQTPQGFKYQAVARDASGNILSNWDIGLRISIHKENQNGQIIYVETHRMKSNNFGLVDLVVGEGDVSLGTFNDIDWGDNRYYIRLEMDMDGNDNFKEMGTSQLYAVPYALYAETAGNIKRDLPVDEGNTSSEGPAKDYQGGTRSGLINSKVSSSGDSWLNALVGNVGIGTDLPAYKLDVIGDVNATNYNVNGSLLSIDHLADGKTGDKSVFLGQGAGGTDAGTALENVAVGDSALFNNSVGNRNTAVGYLALYMNDTSLDNTAIGRGALLYNTAHNNTAVGMEALKNNTSGFYSTATGMLALEHNTIGNINAAFGATALRNNTEGSYNTATGPSALANNTTGNNNTANGYRANFNNQEGSNNTIIGYKAGYGGEDLHSKSGNVFLGYMAGYNDTTDNKLYISNSDADSTQALIWGNFADSVLALNANVGIGTTTPLMTLHVVSPDSNVALLESSQALDTDVSNALYFKTGSGPYPYTGAIKTIGRDPVGARLGLFTYAEATPDLLIERLSIMDDGLVGIGTSSPDEKLHVAGKIKVEDMMQGSSSDSLVTWNPADSTLRVIPNVPSQIHTIHFSASNFSDDVVNTPASTIENYSAWKYRYVNLTDVPFAELYLTFPMPDDFSGTTMTARVYYSSDATTGSFAGNFATKALSVGQQLGLAPGGGGFTVAAPSTAYKMASFTVSFGVNAATEFVYVILRRDSENANDTCLGDMKIFAIAIDYQN